MMQEYADLFVGIVAVALGLFLIGSATTNWKWYYSLTTARWLTRALGRPGARLLHTLFGLGLIALGIAVALGYRWALVGS